MRPREKEERKATAVEKRFLRCFAKLEAKLERVPVLEELQEALEYSSRAAVKDIADRCVRQGWMTPRRVIPMALTDKGRRVCGG